MARHYKPLSSVSRDRVSFFRKRQGPDDVETYATSLQVSMGDCQFQQLEDEITRDIFIQGLNEDRIRDRILKDPERTFEQTVEKVRALEGNSPRAVRGSGSPSRQSWSRGTPTGPREEGRTFRRPDVPHQSMTNTHSSRCSQCSYQIPSGGLHRCPALPKSCNRCGVVDHFGSVCTKIVKSSQEVAVPTDDAKNWKQSRNTSSGS